MPQPFSLTSGNTPFVPHSLAFPKKKARELQALIPELPLSRAQHLVACALGWSDWFSLGQAIKHEDAYPRSLPDEALADVEVIRRFQTQKKALRDNQVAAGDLEHVLASLSLTRSPIAISARKVVGPWGAFDHTPEEIFPGVVKGLCAGTSCYYLTPPRAAEIPLQLQLETGGWYPQDEHEWRIIFTFPRYYNNEQRWQSGKSFAREAPFLYELTTEVPLPLALTYGPSMANRRKAAQDHPDSWFALCARRFKLFGKDLEPVGSLSGTPVINLTDAGPVWSRDNPLYAVGAVRGSTLLELMASGGVWPSNNPPESAWFGLEQSEVLALKMSDSRISGKSGWALPRIAERPFVQSPFARGELVPGNKNLPRHILTQPVMGKPALLA